MESKSIVEQPDAPPSGAGANQEELRTQLHGMWAAVAPSWGEHADHADERGAAAADRMLELTAPGPGERVLELACGPGGLGLAAARRVAPGEAVLSDVAAEMAAIAAARAHGLGLTNVQTRELDLEQIDQPDACYDVVLCREGLMLATDPARAAREIGRVLRPGGRFAVAVWGSRDRNPWLGLVFDAVSAQIGRPVPPPGVPGPFALADAGRLAAVLRDGGLKSVAVSELPVPLRASSFDEWWSRTSALAGPLAMILAHLPEDGRRALRARLQAATAPYETGAGRLEFPGVTLLAAGRRPFQP
jgi:SAM-dependent methyltransferase